MLLSYNKDIRIRLILVNFFYNLDDKFILFQLTIDGALGYENKHFYAGLTGMTLIRNIKYGEYEIDLATEQVRFLVGKRFGIGKKEKAVAD